MGRSPAIDKFWSCFYLKASELTDWVDSNGSGEKKDFIEYVGRVQKTGVIIICQCVSYGDFTEEGKYQDIRSCCGNRVFSSAKKNILLLVS